MLCFVALRGGLANTGAGFVLLDSCFSVVLLVVRSLGSCFLVVLSVVRSFGFVLLVVLFVVRSSGGSYVFFVRCFKSLRGVCGKVRGFLMQR